MSHATYLNMEIIALNIARKEISQMYENLMIPDDEPFNDQDKVLVNFEHGFVACTMLITFFESFLNHILEGILGCEDSLRDQTDKKLKIIYSNYGVDMIFKGTKYWESYGIISRARNELVHFKIRYIGASSGFPFMRVNEVKLIDLFRKTRMEEMLTNIVELTKVIAHDLGLEVNLEAPRTSSPARGGEEIEVYVYDPQNPYHDLD